MLYRISKLSKIKGEKRKKVIQKERKMKKKEKIIEEKDRRMRGTCWYIGEEGRENI